MGGVDGPLMESCSAPEPARATVGEFGVKHLRRTEDREGRDAFFLLSGKGARIVLPCPPTRLFVRMGRKATSGFEPLYEALQASA